MGCRGPSLPRLPRRDRGELARPRAPGVRRSHRHPGGNPRARLELLRDAAAARARVAAQAPRRHRRLGSGVLRQLGGRGQRGRFQARAPPRRRAGWRSRAPPHPCPHRRLPRAHDGNSRAHREALHAGALPADGARRRVHRLNDRGARGGARRPRRRVVRRAHQGRGRSHRPARATFRPPGLSPSVPAHC